MEGFSRAERGTGSHSGSASKVRNRNDLRTNNGILRLVVLAWKSRLRELLARIRQGLGDSTDAVLLDIEATGYLAGEDACSNAGSAGVTRFGLVMGKIKPANRAERLVGAAS